MIKKVVLTMVVVILLVLLFPIPMRLKDGGSVEYRFRKGQGLPGYGTGF